MTISARLKVFHVPPVNKQVCRKSAAALEALSTLFALEHLFRAVDRPDFDYYVMFCLDCFFLWAKLPRIIMRMNVVSESRGMYANALIKKKKDDLQKETRGSQEGYTQVETVVKYLKY